MRCLNCGGEIPSNFNVCPYCGFRVDSMKAQKKKDDETLKKSFEQIDNYFGLNVDYKQLDNDQLAAYYNTFLNKVSQPYFNGQSVKDYFNNLFLKFLGNFVTDYKDYYDKVFSHFNEVSDEYENRNPVDANIFDKLHEEESKANISNSDIVYDLLDNYNPPEFGVAAYKIRSLTEALLRDKYKFPFEDKHFKLHYMVMFKKVTNDKNVAYKMNMIHSLLNLFVHKCNTNDEILDNKFPTIEAKRKFLKESYELYKKWNLA